MRRPRVTPVPAGDLRARLRRLRDLVDWLLLHAELGAELRGQLTALGAPTWTPAEDLSFRGWIETHGDERARQALALLDAGIDARIAKLQTEEGSDEGEMGPA